MNKDKVLFLCTGNTARSQMAEAILRKYAGDHFEVYSAGLEPRPINPYTIQVMEEIGFDLSGQRAKSVKEYLAKVKFAYLITVCAQAEKNCPKTFLGVNQHLFWEFDDPAAFEGTEEEQLQKFREIRDQIDQRLKGWLAEQNIEINAN